MSRAETVALTLAMAASGEQLRLRERVTPVADKHSTGGVGDKVTLVVAPLVAACGLPVAKMSGRGLGHTGGTVDKLESISGFRTELTQDEFAALLERHGLVIAGAVERARPRRRQDVRAARRDRHGGEHPTDRRQYHEQEAGHRSLAPAAGCQGRRGRVHEDASRRAAAGRDDGAHRRGRGRVHGGAAERDGAAAGARGGQRAGDRRDDSASARRRAGRRD